MPNVYILNDEPRYNQVNIEEEPVRGWRGSHATIDENDQIEYNLKQSPNTARSRSTSLERTTI